MQTTYPTDIASGFEGQTADSRLSTKVSRVNAETSANLPFGRAVKDDGTGKGAKLFADEDDSFLGVTAFEHNVNAHLASNGAVEPKRMVAVQTQGAIRVKPEQAVAPGDPVYVRHTAGTGAQTIGRFRKDADTDKAVLLAGARWDSVTTAADQIAVLVLNHPA
jgi:hypothetical protein